MEFSAVPINLTDAFLSVTRYGAEWVMWLLVALSVISVAIMFERAIYFARRRVDVDGLTAALTRQLREGDLHAARESVQGSKAIECMVVRAGLEEAHRGIPAATEAMQSAKLRERLRMESFLSILGTLGNNAPFIGLLGTVLGIIKASQELAAAQAAKETGADAVMGGVFEALVATAVGLFVAIPAVIAFNYFMRRVRARSAQADSLAHLVLSLLHNRVPSTSASTSTPGPPSAANASSAPQTVRVETAQAKHGRK